MTVDATGLEIKTATEIEDEILAALRDPGAFGPELQAGPESPLGQIISIFAAQIATAWEGLQAIYEALNPDAAAGAQLESVAAIAPITRLPDTKSTVVVRWIGTNGTFVPVGAVARIPNGARWITTESGTVSSGRIDLASEAADFGPVAGLTNTIIEPETVIAGISAVDNLADAIEGRFEETDAELRQRREASAAIAGSSSEDAITGRLRTLISVDQARILSNRTDAVDSFGVPAHGMRALVWPASQTTLQRNAIAAMLWTHSPAGIAFDGALSGVTTDSQGVLRTILFSAATQVDVHVEITLTTDPALYGGDAAVSTAVQAATADPQIGADLLLWTIENRVGDDVPGILTIEARAAVGATPGPGDTANISPGLDSIIIVDSGDVTVVSS